MDVLQQQTSLAHLDSLTLRYDLWHLLHGELVINELVFDGAEVSLDLQELEAQAKGGRTSSPVPPPADPTKLPSIPVMLDLKIIAIKDSNFRVWRKNDFAIALRDVDLQAALSAGPVTADLSGTLNVAEVETLVQGKEVRLPLAVEFSLSVDFPSESLEIKRLTLRADPALRMTLSGQVEQFLTNNSVNLSIRDLVIDPGKVSLLAADFLPPEVRDAEIRGTLSHTIAVRGTISESGFNGVVQVEIQGTDLKGAFPSFQLVLDPTTFVLKTSDIAIKGNKPESMEVELTLSNEMVAFQNYRAHGVNVTFVGTYSEHGQVSVSLRFDGQASIPPLGPLPSLRQPFQIYLAGNGDFNDLAFSVEQARVDIGTLLQANLRADLRLASDADGAMHITLNAEVRPQLQELIPLLLTDQLKSLSLHKQAGQDLVKVNVRGKVNPGFEPQQINMPAEVQLAGLATSVPEIHAHGKLKTLNLTVGGVYQSKKGQVQGKVSGYLELADLKYGKTVSVENTALKFGSAFNGNVSPKMKLTNLVSRDTVGLQVNGVRYHDAGVSARLKDLSFSVKTQVDLRGGVYQLASLRVSSGSIFKLIAKGGYRAKERRFSLDASMPSMDVGKLLKHVSIKGMQPILDMKPKGRVSVQVSGAGTVPAVGEMDVFQLPVSLTCQVKLADVSGAFQGNEVVGANGTISVSLQPQKAGDLKASTHLKIGSLHLSPQFPLRLASGVFVDLEVTAKEFDHVELREMRAGFDGADLSRNGSVAGMRGFLENHDTPLGQHLGPLFLKLRSRAAVDLSKFRDLLQSYGLQGSGRAELALSVLKKEQGPVDVQVRLDPQAISMTKHTTRLVNLNGGFNIRKVLEWMPGQNRATPGQVVSPSTILPGLMSYSSQQRDLKIERVDL